jgi:hypothetical protein
MNFLINESQLRVIVLEEQNSKIGDKLRSLHSFTKQIVSDVKAKYGLNLRFLLTWGAAVGGLVGPLDTFLKSGNFNLDDTQKSLILAGVAAMLVYESKDSVQKIISKIKEEGLEDIFSKTLKKGSELKSAFLNFLLSVNVTAGSVSELIAYCFMIPIVGDVLSMAQGSSNPSEAAMLITKRLLASGVITVAGQVLVNLVKKIIKKNY